MLPRPEGGRPGRYRALPVEPCLGRAQPGPAAARPRPPRAASWAPKVPAPGGNSNGQRFLLYLGDTALCEGQRRQCCSSRQHRGCTDHHIPQMKRARRGGSRGDSALAGHGFPEGLPAMPGDSYGIFSAVSSAPDRARSTPGLLRGYRAHLVVLSCSLLSYLAALTPLQPLPPCTDTHGPGKLGAWSCWVAAPG